MPAHTYRLQLIFYFILVVAALVLVFFLFLPFLQFIFLAAIFAIVFAPAYRSILRSVRQRSIAAAISTLLVLVVIFAPLVLFGFLIFREASAVYQSSIAGEGFTAFVAGLIEQAQAFLNSWVPAYSVDLNATLDIHERGREIFGWVASNFSTIFSGSIQVVFGFFLMILALFYFFRDSAQFLSSLAYYSPLKDDHDTMLLNKAKLAVNSVVVGYLVIAIIQGILTGLGFSLFGVPSPALWGAVAAIAALIPTLGTGLVVAPAVIYLGFTASIPQAIGLLVWGALAVGMVDNILGPYLVRRGIQIHPFLILLSVLGGISLLGPIGFIAGPVILSLFVALLDMRKEIVEDDAAESAPGRF